jgi:hypothetical protein
MWELIFCNLLANQCQSLHEIGPINGFLSMLIHTEVNGTGFSLAYLFLENNGNCDNCTWTDIITIFKD